MNIDDIDDLEGLAFIELEPRTWYSFVQLQINLLRNHIEGIEKQIADSIKAYERESVATDVEHDDEGYPFVILEEHRGVEGPPDYLTEIFQYYFPNLQRRGALITLFSFLEHQLDQLCELFASTQQLRITHTDLKDRGIDRSRRYLNRVINLPIDDNSGCWQEIKRIQKIRNVIVHKDGKLVDKDAIKNVKDAKYLSLGNETYFYYREIDEVNILGGYLSYVLDTIDSYCSEINTAIKASVGS